MHDGRGAGVASARMMEEAQELRPDAPSMRTSRRWPFERKKNTTKDTDGNVSMVKEWMGVLPERVAAPPTTTTLHCVNFAVDKKYLWRRQIDNYTSRLYNQ
jgi:hypothetical protein